MTDQLDYRKYLDVHFEAIHDKLDAIELQTTRTNNRVTHLEDKVLEIDEALIKHPINCSLLPVVDKMKEDMLEYKLIKKHPVIAAIIIAIFTIGMLISAYGTFSTMHNRIENQKMMDAVQEIDKNTK